ncbi:recQ-mediated genome instability protein 2-like [Homarus americanus]|uniref:RecQ-mediated genome instability protein 2-like n=1 Tax=Homarus americanus TaxID=6706 RepID=A0A8J5T6C5_HOMAM|nr:recQ-mediated genome instability protein 2-like [Homarus americanus]XP_042214805.1 recQ-mediated genome instability protein 2-like [Homarus americanus]XP_042214806.1 recQ-mediated genome instability protein 2-like [Homarus americanus]KAG7172921.1 RecQ-mediated genome instability protein 2-like [Homarus americanus]
MSGSKFDRPARKLHARDVLRLQFEGDELKFCEDGISVSVPLLWIQGHVVSYNEDKSEVILEDEGFMIKITNCQNNPCGSSWISEGQYVMVVGEINKVAGDKVVQTVKMSDLSASEIHQATWSYEVAEFKMLMKENPSIFE